MIKKKSVDLRQLPSTSDNRLFDTTNERRKSVPQAAKGATIATINVFGFLFPVHHTFSPMEQLLLLGFEFDYLWNHVACFRPLRFDGHSRYYSSPSFHGKRFHPFSCTRGGPGVS